MRFAMVRVLILSAALTVLAACSEKRGQAPEPSGSGVSSADAASVGTSVSTIVELSDMYVSPEIYDLKMTVAEVVRGEPASGIMNKLGSAHVRTPADSECLLARVRFEYKARGAPGDKPWELKSAQFSAFSEDKKSYASPSIMTRQPGRSPLLHSGDTLECWLAFVVARYDRKPVMIYNPGTSWFRLY